MTSIKQKILIVHNYYQIPGGEDTVVANEKKMLENHGHEVILYSRTNSEIKKMSMLQKLVLPLTSIFNIRTYIEIRNILKKHKIEIVHVHNTLNLISPSVYYAALSMKIPVVQTIHNFRLLCPGATFYRKGHICEECVNKGLHCALKYGCYRNSKIQTLVCIFSTKIHRLTGVYGKINYICLTEFNKNKLLKLKEIRDENIFVKPNFAIDVAKNTAPEPLYYQLIYVGRLEEIKGIKILLKAWKLIEGKIDAHLLICGNGPLEAWCENYIGEQQLKNVEMKGFVPHEQVLNLIADSKAFLFPTQVYEGFPMAVVESYCLGIPVIGSNIGNTANLIEDGRTGLLFNAKSVEDFANKIMTFIDMDDKIFGQNARGIFESKYTETINIQLLNQIYHQISSMVVEGSNE